MTAPPPRVLVMRPRAEAERTAQQLARMGCEPVVAPVLEIVALDTCEPFPGTPDILVATSANALAGPLKSEWLDLPVFAVGEATASAARTAGLRRVSEAGGDVASLVEVLLRDTAPAARLLFLTGRPRKPDLEDALGRAGRVLQVAERYEARVVTWTAPTTADLRRAPPAAALHYSPRSARLATAAAHGADLDGAWRFMQHVCLSADVAAALPPMNGRTPVVAIRPNGESLLQALADILLPP